MLRSSFFSVLLMYFCLIVDSPASGQSIWEWQNPLPQGNTLYDIDLFGASIAVACGKRATIVATTDGGSTWNVTSLANGATNSLYGISIVNATTIVAVGNGGMIIRSSDGGVSWSSPGSGVSSDLNDVASFGSTFCVAVGDGGVIIASIDGGASWSPQSSGTSANLFSVHVIDINTATAIGSGGIIRRTIDGGVTWIPQTSGVTTTLKGVHFIDANTGIAVGNGPVAIGTTNGGATWTPQTMPSYPPDFYADLESIWMISANDVVAVGTFETDYSEEYGLVMRSANGGASWDSNTWGDFLYGIAMFGLDDGLAVGAAGTIRQITSGLNWPRVGGAEKKYVAEAVDFSSSLLGVAVASDDPTFSNPGNSRMYYTIDGGGTWDYTEVFAYHLVDVAFADALTVWAVGEGWPAMDQGSTIWKSDDGGVRWGAIYITYCAPDGTGCEYYFSMANAVDFAESDFGVAVGTEGAIVRIINEGPWPVETPFSVTLNGVSVPSSEAVYAVGNNGFIAKGTSSGSVWTPQTSGTTVRLNDVAFVNDVTGTAVGELGTILRTTDGGANWIPQVSGTTASLASVSFFDASCGIVTSGATLLKTVDGGTTWVPEPTPCSMVDAVLIDIANVEAVGGSECIIARRDVSIPVLFQQFIAVTSGRSVHLTWEVWSDVLINEFHLYRSEGVSMEDRILHARIESQQRTFTDIDVQQGVEYNYLLVAVASDGHETWSQEVSAQIPVVALELLQNHPNPFNPSTTIRFRIPDRQHVELTIYDVSGAYIVTLIDAPCELGEKSLRWDGRDKSGNPVGSGIYFYQLTAGSKRLSKKMVLLR